MTVVMEVLNRLDVSRRLRWVSCRMLAVLRRLWQMRAVVIAAGRLLLEARSRLDCVVIGRLVVVVLVARLRLGRFAV